jgi:uncharacterized protein
MEKEVQRRLSVSPVVALLGPRQCGKSTLARQIVAAREDAVLLDLERQSDLRKLSDPEAYFALHRDHLVCLDEIQRVPELFPEIRAKVDETSAPGQVLVLGSASPDLLRQSSESLAGRISYLELTPFLHPELHEAGGDDPTGTLWLRGGFPRSYLADTEELSVLWREDFVRTFLSRDLAAHAPRVSPGRLGRLWRMCAHEHGQLLNSSRLGSALGVSDHTVRAHIDLLAATYMVRVLEPLEANLGKRLVRSPRVYLRDSGVLHSLLEIDDHDELLGHPTRGASWEGLVIEHAIAALPQWRASFFRTHSGAEIDLILERGPRRIAIEAKASTAPRPARGFWSSVADLGIEAGFVVAPIGDRYPLRGGVEVLGLSALAGALRRQSDAR